MDHAGNPVVGEVFEQIRVVGEFLAVLEAVTVLIDARHLATDLDKDVFEVRSRRCRES